MDQVLWQYICQLAKSKKIQNPKNNLKRFQKETKCPKAQLPKGPSAQRPKCPKAQVSKGTCPKGEINDSTESRGHLDYGGLKMFSKTEKKITKEYLLISPKSGLLEVRTKGGGEERSKRRGEIAEKGKIWRPNLVVVKKCQKTFRYYYILYNTVVVHSILLSSSSTVLMCFPEVTFGFCPGLIVYFSGGN